MLKVFEAFAGYGSQSISLKDLGINHKVVGISEIDVDAIIAYGSIRYNLDDIKINDNITIEDMKSHLISKNIGKDFKTSKSKISKMKKDKLKMLYKFDIASNNFGDISIINPNDLPDFDYFTYSFPCSDCSIAGKQQGLIKGQTRSGLLYECEKIIETKKPKYLLMENVKALVQKKFKPKFDEWCDYLSNLGYNNYWFVLNAKDFGIPQNRERVFMISILGEYTTYEIPKGFLLNKRLKDFLEIDFDKKYFLSDKIQERFKQTKEDDGINNIIGSTQPECRTIGQRDLVYSSNAPLMYPLMATDYKQPKQIVHKLKNEEISINRIGGLFDKDNKKQAGSIYDKNGYIPTLTTMQGGYRMPLTIQNYKIRKLTPKECLRLMGLPDNIIDKMQQIGLSDSALYKLAGNSIVKQCLDAIHINLFNNK